MRFNNMNSKGISLLAFLMIVVKLACLSQDYPLWENLKAGKFSVGFKRIYCFDSSRKYAFKYLPKVNEDTTLYYRPMILNIWYPTEGKTNYLQKYEEYFEFRAPDSSWGNFLTRLKDFNIQVAKDNSFAKPVGQNTDQLKLFTTLLQTSTSIRCNSEPLKQKHPLILYYPGMGGTVEESSVLCEYLSSHGYVVVSSLYQPNHIKHLYSDWDLDRSCKDRNFILKKLDMEKYIDLSKIALIGFSFGAQSNLYYEISENSSIKSVVLLDSRLEYSFNCHPTAFKGLPDSLLANKNKIKIPMLCVTESNSTYALFDSLSYCDRKYLRFPYLKHYNFTSQSGISQYLNYRADSSLCLLKRNWDLYKILCRNILSFINSNFTNSIYNKAIDYENNCLSEENEIKIVYEHRMKDEFLTIGDSTITKIILPVQLIRLIQATSFSYVNLNYPHLLLNKNLVSEELNNNFGYYLLQVNNIEEAIEIFKWNVQLFKESWNAYDSLGKAYSLNNQNDKAIVCYKKSLEINPENKKAVEILSTLK